MLGRLVTFSYLGYLWALIGCFLLVFVVGGTGLVLYAIGRRREPHEPRVIVESVPIGIPRERRTLPPGA
jgi:hypothetical protein